MLRDAVFVAYGIGFIAAAVAVREGFLNLVAAFLARRDLARALARMSPDRKVLLRDLLNARDTVAAVALISEHLPELPPRERAHATDALTQRSEFGRRTYAGGIALAAGLRP